MKILICFIFSAFLFGEMPALQLSSLLKKAEPGTFIVTESRKQITVISIQSIDQNICTFEEISAPQKKLSPLPKSWQEWVQKKAPNHSSWSRVKIDLETGKVVSAYSFSKHCYLKVSDKESFLGQILLLPLLKTPIEKQKKIGPPPLDGEQDTRKLWVPPLVFEGNKIQNPKFHVLHAVWPQDGSEIQGQEVTLYLDAEMRVPFPYLVQIQTSHLSESVRTIDSGTNLFSPMATTRN